MSLLSKCMPKYFTQFFVFSVALFSFTSGVETYLAKIMCVDLLEFVLIIHFLAQVAISFKDVCNKFVALIGLSYKAKITLSSAYVAVVMFSLQGRSAVNNWYRTGPSTLPCGTLGFIG